MKRTILTAVIASSLFLFSCKKSYENAVEEAVISAITTGNWNVTEYIKGGTNVTSSFSEYKFMFQNNRTVDAIRNNVVEASGAWEENAQARSIYAQFAPSTAASLQLLNGTWQITKN